MPIGDRIQNARKKAGLSQKGLAARLDVSDKTVSAWERGSASPNEDKLIRLMSVLEVDANYLYCDVIQHEQQLSRKEQELIDDLRLLDESQFQTIRDLVTSMVRNRIIEEEKEEQMPLWIERPFFMARPSAGFGNDIFDESETIRVEDSRIARKADFILQVDGASMQPKFRNGDFIGVKKTDHVPENSVGVFVVDGEVYIKQALPGRLHSLNPRYPDVPVNEFSEIYPMGTVLGKVHIADE